MAPLSAKTVASLQVLPVPPWLSIIVSETRNTTPTPATVLAARKLFAFLLNIPFLDKYQLRRSGSDLAVSFQDSVHFSTFINTIVQIAPNRGFALRSSPKPP